jgi:hypothetical protein
VLAPPPLKLFPEIVALVPPDTPSTRMPGPVTVLSEILTVPVPETDAAQGLPLSALFVMSTRRPLSSVTNVPPVMFMFWRWTLPAPLIEMPPIRVPPDPATVVSGALDSTPSTSFQVELFDNAACNPSGKGEARHWSRRRA